MVPVTTDSTPAKPWCSGASHLAWRRPSALSGEMPRPGVPVPPGYAYSCASVSDALGCTQHLAAPAAHAPFSIGQRRALCLLRWLRSPLEPGTPVVPGPLYASLNDTAFRWCQHLLEQEPAASAAPVHPFGFGAPVAPCRSYKNGTCLSRPCFPGARASCPLAPLAMICCACRCSVSSFPTRPGSPVVPAGRIGCVGTEKGETSIVAPLRNKPAASAAPFHPFDLRLQNC